MRRIATRPGAWALGVVCLWSGPVLAVDGNVFRGVARDAASGQVLYREAHYVSAAGTPREKRIVHYECARGSAVFARKELDYASARETPLFTLTDALWGYVEGLRALPDGRLQVFQVPGRGRAERSAVLPAANLPVADAGFDEFLRQHWAQLERGASIKFAFLVPSRLHALQFKVAKQRDESIDGESASVIRLSLAGVIGWFLPDIEATYRKSDRALLRYVGVTNLRDAAGHNFNARIDFPAAERRRQPVDLATLRAMPLVSRCG